MNQPKLAARFSLAAAAMFFLLVALQLGTGASQHFFELVHSPGEYAAQLVAKGSALQGIIAIDDVFIGIYVGAAVFALACFPASWARSLAVAAVIMAGLLDLEENHHLLSLLAAAQAGIEIPASDLIRRMDLSSVKWGLGHLGFFFFALATPGEIALAKAFRGLTIYLQLPLGVAGVVYGDLLWLQLLRAFNLFAGFLLVAVLLARLYGGAVGSGVRASPRDTTPAAVG
ncbi:MAG: hypothetical protein U1E65_20025 [Myxococcota bacterium]